MLSLGNKGGACNEEEVGLQGVFVEEGEKVHGEVSTGACQVGDVVLA